GGLADVVSALPKALAAEGIEARVLLPGYPAVKAALADGAAVEQGEIFGGPARLIGGRAEGLELIVLDAPHLYDRPGNPYLGPDRLDWPDNAERYAALSDLAARIAADGAFGWRPDLLHAHDWQAGLAPAYLEFRGVAVPSVLTIHNMAFQGIFPAAKLGPLGLPHAGFTHEGFEFWGKIGFLKAGLVYADRITTVSPTYARELATPEFGMGLEGVIAERRGAMTGVLNGVDTEIWNPETDALVPATYSMRRRKGKEENRRALMERFGLKDSAGPIFCMVSRLTWQKGVDLLVEALPRLFARGASLALIGSGDHEYELALEAAAATHPGAIGTIIGYDEAVSHLLIAGADAILVPSRFEPCGLTQLYGLRYGTLPVVARTGGLADTVIDANEAAIVAGCATGFQFRTGSVAALGDAVDRVCDLYADQRAWEATVRRAMAHPVGWETSARVYARLYAELAGGD
ncbi:MAG TPA: glycogen synthase GlgA, partial [Paracoccaceae bacterium]|nr:glycogen synthase GlgA [Paracoccaceae bacterium]